METLQDRRNQLLGVLVDGVEDWNQYLMLKGEIKAIDRLISDIADLLERASRAE